MAKKEETAWSPYVAGAFAGFFAILSIWIAGKFLGASTTFVRAAGMIEGFFASERVAEMEYYASQKVQFDWQFLFVIGIAVGSLIAALTSESFRWQAVPNMWEERFGSNVWKRAVVAFPGGLIAIFGARMAGGCPSGHGLSGSIQMAISGFVAMAGFFVAGAVVARILYGRGKEQ